MHNARFWRGYFKTMFVPHLERTLEALEHRVLPAFDGIDAEATDIQNKTYDELMEHPGDPDADWFSFGEAAHEAAVDAGFAHYSELEAVKQSLLNSFAPILYHAWEQQLIAFHRKEILHPSEEHRNDLMHPKELRRRLMKKGVDITKLPSWPAIEEFGLVANTVKHADGWSADVLKKTRPEMFEQRDSDFKLKAHHPRTRRVYTPLSGDDLYLTLADLQSYGRATIAFWSEFADALEHG
jgi:hypothetical protein